jgi:hypothetical protein
MAAIIGSHSTREEGYSPLPAPQEARIIRLENWGIGNTRPPQGHALFFASFSGPR